MIEKIVLTPDFSTDAAKTIFGDLFHKGNILDLYLEQQCKKLKNLFKVFASTSPVPEWSYGIVITDEMRKQSELYLPLAEIAPAFNYLCLTACKYKPFLEVLPLNCSLSWVDALVKFKMPEISFNPGKLLYNISTDEKLRQRFLASVFLPLRYGGNFGRYPKQSKFLQNRLKTMNTKGIKNIRILDAACGSGEGTYEVAKILIETGFAPEECQIDGITIEPLELVAAAYGEFPGYPDRSSEFRKFAEPIARSGGDRMIKFRQGDISSKTAYKGKYDIIICNGLLGGPLLHKVDNLKKVANLFATHLKYGGTVLVANHFHSGWNRPDNVTGLINMFKQQGFSATSIEEGFCFTSNAK
ncbi:MAG: chemotaxis protein CheR [Desulfuromonadales bacterium]|nr:chemotaxis protein CheR [Desulfuromonadales bacterium]